MIPFKIFIQLIFALNLSDNSSVDQHLCAAIRDVKNYKQNIQTCANSGLEIDCLSVVKKKCGYD